MKRALSTLICGLALSGCATTQVGSGEPVPLENVIRQVKKDIGDYNAYAVDAAKAEPLTNACKSKVDLTVSAVTVSVTTASKVTDNVNVGAQVQPDPFIKVGLTGGGSRAISNSEVLTFTLVPETLADGRAAAKEPGALYRVLSNLRESMLRSGDTTPCLKFPPEKDQKNNVEFGFTATNGTTSGVLVNLFIFSLGASHGNERTAANKITIAFTGEGQAIQ